ncbi:AMP-binding protein, partial [Serratia marcescens]|uniref:AMP-binding protein n=1 Tax=Serratia marcescens TaxID=615 RepID=UPI001C37BAF1
RNVFIHCLRGIMTEKGVQHSALDATLQRLLRMSDARLVVTNVANRAKLDEIAGCPPVATVREPGETLPENDIDFRAALDAQPDSFEPVLRKGTDLFMMMSTSGTTGLPKGVPVPLRALLAFG